MLRGGRSGVVLHGGLCLTFFKGGLAAGEEDGIVGLAATQHSNHDERHQRNHEDDDACPHVQAGSDAEEGDLLGGVNAEHFNPDAAGCVNHGVEQEEASVAQLQLSVQQEQYRNAGQVPEALVQERGVEEGIGAEAHRNEFR